MAGRSTDGSADEGVGERVEAGDGGASEGGEKPDEDDGGTPDWSRENWAVILFFLALTVVGLAVSTGYFRFGIVLPRPGKEGLAAVEGVAVPLYVYLYSFLGALGYIFTRLMTKLDEYDQWGEFERLAEMGLRIPAAWLLASGVFLLATPLLGPSVAKQPRLLAGAAFLVGLYVNVAFKALGGLADRVLGRGAR